MTTELRNSAGKVWRTLRRDGARGVAQRAARMAYQRLDVASLDASLLPEDVADSRLMAPRRPRPGVPRDRPLTVGWVTTPPALGSGGHTTMFRMIEALESAGHHCVVLLYDRYGGDPVPQAEVIRRGWPGVKAPVSSVRAGFDGLDAVVATSWPTAHVIARHADPELAGFYFVQDFEPYFYPRGSEYALAEDSYRLGLRCVALGEMVTDELRTIGIDPATVPFGCDTGTYQRTEPPRERRGVVFYTRPGVGRRGFELGVLALREFHDRRPEQPIHVYGDTSAPLPFEAARHARMTPADLNELYNGVLAGLALSFTNISLVAEEMLAAGCVPVINDGSGPRADLPNPHAVWGHPSPHGLAAALDSVFAASAESRAERAGRAADSVVGRSWDDTGGRLVEIIEAGTYAG